MRDRITKADGRCRCSYWKVSSCRCAESLRRAACYSLVILALSTLPGTHLALRTSDAGPPFACRESEDL